MRLYFYTGQLEFKFQYIYMSFRVYILKWFLLLLLGCRIKDSWSGKSFNLPEDRTSRALTQSRRQLPKLNFCNSLYRFRYWALYMYWIQTTLFICKVIWTVSSCTDVSIASFVFLASEPRLTRIVDVAGDENTFLGF